MFGNFNENGPYGVDKDQKRTSSSCVRFIIFSFTKKFQMEHYFWFTFSHCFSISQKVFLEH